ncbi:MAG: prepilin-type N-terminal cleavage/methylation domain-containing protein [Candidatus Falkowbacteria bacterium]|nr:prepilin-type N-terminal cleavage/methylation domain-containing protein [Candidatus Falkowbacteria bacterium]
MLQNKRLKLGFTLIELLVVIAIIGVLSTMAIIALGNARAKARDSKRVADIKQISTALELYYSDYNTYPTIITPGNSLASPDGTKTYMGKIPTNPTPRNDGTCGDNNYSYASTSDNTNYSLNFCLGNAVSSTPASINSASNTGFGTAPGLIGWWKFDEGSGTTAIDSSGNNKSGTLVGSPTYVAGKSGNALQFTGTNLVRIGANSDFVFQEGNYWTISLYVNTTSSYVGAGTTGADILGKAIVGATSAYAITVGNVNGSGMDNKVGFTIDSAPGNNYSTGNPAIPALNDGLWHHIVIVYDASSGPTYTKGTIYYDGTSYGTYNANTLKTGWATSSSYALAIGTAYVSCPSLCFSGKVDDVRIYNRALSAAEVIALYNATK